MTRKYTLKQANALFNIDGFQLIEIERLNNGHFFVEIPVFVKIPDNHYKEFDAYDGSAILSHLVGKLQKDLAEGKYNHGAFCYIPEPELVEGACSELPDFCLVNLFDHELLKRKVHLYNVDELMQLTKKLYFMPEINYVKFMAIFSDINWSLDRQNSYYSTYQEIYELLIERQEILTKAGYFQQENENMTAKTPVQQAFTELLESANKHQVVLEKIDSVGNLSADIYARNVKYIGTIACVFDSMDNPTWYVFYSKTNSVRNKVDSPDVAIERLMDKRGIKISEYLGIQ